MLNEIFVETYAFIIVKTAFSLVRDLFFSFSNAGVHLRGGGGGGPLPPRTDLAPPRTHRFHSRIK